VFNAAAVALRQDAGAPPCPVFGEAGGDLVVISVHEADVVPGVGQGLGEVDNVDHGMRRYLISSTMCSNRSIRRRWSSCICAIESGDFCLSGAPFAVHSHSNILSLMLDIDWMH